MILGSGALVKLKGLAALALKKTKAKVLLQRIFQGITIPKIFQKPKPNVIPKIPKVTPRTLRSERDFNIKTLRNALKRTSGKDTKERVEILDKALQVLRTMRQGVSSRAGGELTRGNRANFNEIKKILNSYDKEIQKIDRAIKFIKRNDKLTIDKALEKAVQNIKSRQIRGRLRKERVKSIKESNKGIREFIEKSDLSPDSPLYEIFKKLKFPKKKFNKIKNKNNVSNVIIKEGDNYLAYNLSDSPTIMGDNFDPYISSLNTIKAYSEQTA